MELMIADKDWKLVRQAGVITRPVRDERWMYVDIKEDNSRIPLHAVKQRQKLELIVAEYPNARINQWIVAHEKKGMAAPQLPVVTEKVKDVARSTVPLVAIGLGAMVALTVGLLSALATIDPALIAVVENTDTGDSYWICVATWYDL